MQPDHVADVVHAGQLGRDLRAPRLERPEPIVDRDAGHQAIRDLIDQALRAPRDFPQLPLQPTAPGAVILGPPGVLGVKLPHEGLDQLGRQHLLANRRQDARLDVDRLGRPAVGAGRRAAFSPARTQHPPLRTAGDHGPIAAAASQQAREKPFGPPGPLRPGARRHGAHLRLYGIPEALIDDGQFGGRGPDQVLRRGRAGAALARLAILDPRLTAPNHLAGVQGVVQQTVAARRIAVDRRGVPHAAARARDVAGVKAGGDGPGRLAGRVGAKDLAHDLGLIRIDIEQAGDGQAVVAQLDLAAIAIGGRTAGVTPFARDARQAASRLARQLFQEQGVHRALQPDVQGLGLALGDGVDGDAGGLEVVVYVPSVAARAGQSIQRFTDDDIEAAPARGRHEGVETGPVGDGRAGNGRVAEFAHYLGPQAHGVRTADDQLIGDRGGVLQVGAEAGVEGGAHRLLGRPGPAPVGRKLFRRRLPRKRLHERDHRRGRRRGARCRAGASEGHGQPCSVSGAKS